MVDSLLTEIKDAIANNPDNIKDIEKDIEEYNSIIRKIEAAANVNV